AGMKRAVIVAALLAASVHGAHGFEWNQARLKGSPSSAVGARGFQPSEQAGQKSSASTGVRVDLGKETVGRPPAAFEPMVGTWLVAQDGADKVIMVDGRPWVASKDNPTRLLIESARRLYGTSNEELMDN